ncbi:fimbria/pilus outer membrane usher protein [Gallibacterium trehalosifermentans]|uniref:Fimbria/pilus outer membrane usher protein n=1 Tax=Gallibacterium trehalosifermentans TaxID=516935 RepID=A0ABV6GZK6_9PAST
MRWKQTGVFVSLALLSQFLIPAQANDFFEFDADFLSGSAKSSIDISRFSYGNPIPVGNYLADVYLNNHFRGRVNLQFVDHPEKKQSVLCQNDALLAVLDLKADALLEQDSAALGCQLFALVPEGKMAFDMSQLRLDVDLPQALIVQRPLGYISPAQWQDGVPVAFVRYDASHYRYQYSDSTAKQDYLGIDAGINLFGWAFRHRGSQSWQDQQRLPYQSIATYAQRDIAALRGQLTIGDFYTSGLLMESMAIRGVQLASDERMLATSERGYAPTIRGVANSNARVRIRQKGNVLREVMVPAGAFEINDLFPTGYGGDIEVEILEANGEKRSFTVPYTAAVELIRPGYSRYQLSAGRYRYEDKISKTNVAQATWQYGLSNNVTLNLGGTFSKDYHAELIGLSVNTPLGTIATSATFSNAKFRNSDTKRKGYSLYASYNTRLEPTNTNVTLAAYRYLSRDYYSVQDVIKANDSEFIDDSLLDLGLYNTRPKNQFEVAISQAFRPGWGSAYLIGSTSTYWGSNKKQNGYQIGYGNSYKQLSYSFSFSQTKNSEGEKENQFYLNLSLAFGESNTTYLSEVLSYNAQNGYFSTTSLSGSAGKDYRYSYNLSVSKQKENSNISFSNNYRGSLANIGASWSQDNQHNRQMSLNLSGAVVAHPKGITLSNDLSNHFAIIHAAGARGAKIRGSIGNEIDYFGNGIVPYVDPYAVNYIGLDLSDVPDRVELSSTDQQIIPRANSAILVDFATKVGNVVFFELTNMTEFPPIGTEVFDQAGQAVGIVSQGGRIYTRGVEKKGQLSLQWGDKQCQFTYQVPDAADNGELVIVPVQCQMK